MSRLEPVAFGVALALLALLVGAEGRRRVELERQVAVGPRELYRALARSQQGIQVIDVRPELAEGYDDSHLPGSLPVPSCDLARAPAAARERILRSAPTVVVSATGSRDEVGACLDRFTAARSLAGGMVAWSAARLPEDSGEYAPPSAKAGGGCL
jgi:rhodanese-related sulfurtransferase